jgi:Icc-related predicted phosphoesterase
MERFLTWDHAMTTLGVIGDVHAHFGRLAPVIAYLRSAQVDGVLLVGDLGSNDVSLERLRTQTGDSAYLRSVDDVLARVRALGVPVLWVPGNHDLPSLSGEGNIDGRAATVAGLRVAGIGGAGPQRFGFCYEWDEDRVRALRLPVADVLLCHCPPAGTPLDLVPGAGVHVGSQAIRERAAAHRGFLVCGHIHESPGAARVGACLCLNAGGLGPPFGRAQVGLLRRRDGQPDEVGHVDLASGGERWWRLDDAPAGERA